METKALRLFATTVGIAFATLQTACRDVQPFGNVAEQPAIVTGEGLVRGDSVMTPAGWRLRSCVHRVPSGSNIDPSGTVVMPDGRSQYFALCNAPKRPRGSYLSSGDSLPPTIDGWLEYTPFSLGGTDRFHQITASWIVPNIPVTSNFAQYYSVYYSFPGIRNDSFILQPVIGYGDQGNYWSGTSWICDNGANCHSSTPISLSPGDSIDGSVIASSCSGGHCTWTVTLTDVTQSTYTVYTTTSGDNYNSGVGAAVEVHNFQSCSQFPEYGIQYSSVKMYDQNMSLLSAPSPSWAQNFGYLGSPVCSYGISTSGRSITLFHNPPLVATIGADSTSYYGAHASGGYTAYEYNWEYCYWDCGGDALRSGPAGGGRGGQPNAVRSRSRSAGTISSIGRGVGVSVGGGGGGHTDSYDPGWHDLVTTATAYWPGASESTLRLTVTDAHGAQTVATYVVP